MFASLKQHCRTFFSHVLVLQTSVHTRWAAWNSFQLGNRLRRWDYSTFLVFIFGVRLHALLKNERIFVNTHEGRSSFFISCEAVQWITGSRSLKGKRNTCVEFDLFLLFCSKVSFVFVADDFFDHWPSREGLLSLGTVTEVDCSGTSGYNMTLLQTDLAKKERKK